jgi:hypothetical protein
MVAKYWTSPTSLAQSKCKLEITKESCHGMMSVSNAPLLKISKDQDEYQKTPEHPTSRMLQQNVAD